jgi:hypothetical protein
MFITIHCEAFAVHVNLETLKFSSGTCCGMTSQHHCFPTSSFSPTVTSLSKFPKQILLASLRDCCISGLEGFFLCWHCICSLTVEVKVMRSNLGFVYTRTILTPKVASLSQCHHTFHTQASRTTLCDMPNSRYVSMQPFLH